MKLFKTEKKAFSLIEVIIVMGIIASLFTIGIFSFTFYKSSVELQNSYLNLVSFMQDLQNEAKNSVMHEELDISSSGTIISKIPDYYILVIDNNDYTSIFCKEGTSSLVCTTADWTKKQNKYSAISIKTVEPNCTRIVFQKRNMNILAMNQATGAFIDTGTCTIEVSHSGKSGKKIITLDLQKNTIDEKNT